MNSKILKMYAIRANQAIIKESFYSPFVTAILGPRRVGKTTFVQHFVRENVKEELSVFMNMDSLSNRQQVEREQLRNLIEMAALQKIGGEKKIWVIIDEAQKCPALFEQIKIIYDEFKDRNAIKFILTGSGFLTLHQLTAESLAGRIQLYYLREFGLLEAARLIVDKPIPVISPLEILCNHKNDGLLSVVNELNPYKNVLMTALFSQLMWGGLPEVLQLVEDNDKISYLANYLQTYLEKDIRSITSITDLNLYQKLMEVVASQTGSVRDDTRIMEALGCSRDTLKKYRGFLEATLMYKEVYPFINSSLKRLVKSPKGYLLNNGLISYLTGIYDKRVLENSGLIGQRFENWLLNELQIWLDRDPRRSKIYYWRTTGGLEVDFVVERKPDIFPFEITYSEQIQNKKINNLRKFMQLEKAARVGFYIYKGNYHYDDKNHIYFLPAWLLG